jgi:hypothetical protein
MALSSDNYPPPVVDKGGGGWGGAGSGWNLAKEYAEIYDGWIGGFWIGEEGELSGYGVDLHPWDGVELSTLGALMHWGTKVCKVGELSDSRKSLMPWSHNTRHLGASDVRWRTGWFVNIFSSGGFTTADLLFKNDWVITEEEDKLIFINPKGKKVIEVNPDGQIQKVKDNKKYNNVERFKKRIEENKAIKLTKEEIDEQIKQKRKENRHKFLEGLTKNQRK